MEAGRLAAATQNMLLAATAPGVGSCYKLISIVALGYGTSPTQPPSKRPLPEVLHWESF